MLDILIKNAAVIDGSGAEAVVSDVGVKGDLIAGMGQIPNREAVVSIDADGLTLCPGFIDAHSHSDFNILAEPSGASKVRQGVTTEVCGNCGLSAVPLSGPYRQQREKDSQALGVTIGWSDLKTYCHVVQKKGLLVNIVPLIGHGNLRGAVMGYAGRPASAAETNEMKELLKRELAAGAWGLSSGLIYPPGVYAEKEELIALNRVVKAFQGIYTTHMRSEGDGLLEAVDEALFTAETAGVPVQISHLKTLGKKNWPKLPAVFEKIELAQKRGVRVTADRYPYVASSTGLDAILPAWACADGAQAEIARITSVDHREKIFAEVLTHYTEKEISETVLISRVVSEKNRKFEGRFMGETARIRGQALKDAFFDILIEEDLAVDAIFFSMSEKNLKQILQKEYVMPGSDAAAWGTEGPLAAGRPHPRAFGTFPRFLQKYALQEHLFSLVKAVNKMTAFPAQTFGLRDRGFIRKGFKADMVMFDSQRLFDRSTYATPHQYPEGIVGVMVNGKWVVNKGAGTGARPGKVLLKTPYF